MKSNIKVAAVAVSLAMGVSAFAQGFIRPQISYVSPTNDVRFSFSDETQKLGGTMGYGIVGGATFGAQDEHEVSLEISFADFKASVSTTEEFTVDDITYSSGTETVKADSMPILLNYRYYIGDKTSAARVYIAPTIGLTHVKLTDNASGVEAGLDPVTDTYSNSESKNGFTWAIGVGVMVKVTDKIGWDIGYRYMSAHIVSGTDLKTHNIYTGVNFKF